MSYNIVAVMGSYRKKHTYRTVQQFEERLRSRGEFDFEYVWLKDLDLRSCRGCFLCLERGEEFCPGKNDDVQKVFEKMMRANGVILASPVYSLQVTALMKLLLDRLAYIFHRPCFFHKSFIPIVTQGVYGKESVLKYLEEVAGFWGFKVSRGLGITVSDKPLNAEREKNDAEIEKAAERFYKVLTSPPALPSMKDVMIFRSIRSIHRAGAGLPRDQEYFRERGWLESPYFYETDLGWAKRVLGSWIDKKVAKQGEEMKRERERLEP